MFQIFPATGYQAAKRSHCSDEGTSPAVSDKASSKNDYPGAVEQYSKVIAFDPDFLSARNGRAFAELQLERPASAVDDFTYLASRGDAYAQDVFGRMYLLGTSSPRDRGKAISWLKKAAAQGYEPAAKLLPFALDEIAAPLPSPGNGRL